MRNAPIEPPKFKSVLKTAVIDNSALMRLIDSDESTKALKGFLQAKPIRIILTIDILNEVWLGGDRSRVIERNRRLAELHVELGHAKVIIASALRVWLTNEGRRGGVLNRIPAFTSSPRYPNFLRMLQTPSDFEEILRRSGDEPDEARRRKEQLKAADQQFRLAAKTFSQAELREAILNYRPTTRMTQLDAFLPALSFVPGLTRSRFRRILHETERYPLFRSYVYLLHVRSLGNGLSQYFQGDDNLQCFNRIIQGNWYDLAIIVAAGQFEYLVSEDKGQCAIAKIMTDRGLIKCTGIGSGEFLAL